MSRCPTCGRVLYDKKGFNKKSLKNLTSYGHDRKDHNTKRPIRHIDRCVMDNCKSIRVRGSNLCLVHYVIREQMIRSDKIN